MRRFERSGKILLAAACCFFGMTTACGMHPQEIPEIIIFEGRVQSPIWEDCEDEDPAVSVWRDACEEIAEMEVLDRLERMQKMISSLGASGYAAVDSENQVDMANADQVLAFCSAVDAKEKAELTVIEAVRVEPVEEKAATASAFRRYDFQTEDGKVDIVRGYYGFDGYGNLVNEDVVSYPAELWQYTAEGYLVFGGSYFADDYYIISLTDEAEYTALRVERLDARCRELYQKYIQPVGYEYNNLFLVNWSEEDFGDLDFYDLFDKFYPVIYQRPIPYTASENPGIGIVYRIPENEFEKVIGTYFNVEPDTLRSEMAYLPEEKTYEYKPRGFYEIECSNMPYPEVVGYAENGDDTIALKVNAVFPYECTSKAFSHEVVIRLLEDGSFQYVSNKIMEGGYDAWWHVERLTNDEWEEVYRSHDTGGNSAGDSESETDGELWYLPQADNSLLEESEKEELNNMALAAAEQVREVYQDMEIEEGASYDSNVKNFSRAQCREVVERLGRAGFVSVTEETNMENYQKVESFYAEYKKGHDAMVTVLNVNGDGLIGAVTFIYRRDELQTYYVGVGWQEGGIPRIKNTLTSDLSGINLTEKGYFIYTYKDQIVHSDANAYLRVRPLPEKCRQLTETYIAGISFVNYNAFMTNWDSSNVEDILMPCMFEDIYRIDTGENIKVEKDRILADVYERIMMTYFPVSKEQLRSKCGYDPDSGSYPYEMIFANPHAPFGEVTDYTENQDGTITLFVEGVWIDYNSDCAFVSTIVVQPFSDGTFRYLSNKIQPKELELPTAASPIGSYSGKVGFLPATGEYKKLEKSEKNACIFPGHGIY